MGTSHGSKPRGRSAGAGRSLVHEQQTRDEATWKDVWRGTEPREATVGHGTKPRARQAGSRQTGEHPLPPAFLAGPPAAFAPSTYYAFENAGVYIYMYICILDIRDGKAPTC